MPPFTESSADDFRLSEAVTPAVQLRTLRTLLRRVEHETARGGRPVVEVDLDLCSLMPIFRTQEALRMVGEEFGIAEFQSPERLGKLPGYSDEAWQAFLGESDLEGKYCHLRWREQGRPTRGPGTPFGRFHELYWTTAWLEEDSPTPGLGAFVHHIDALGGVVVFISGRWLAEHVKGTRASLRRAGIPDPVLVIGNPWHETLQAPGGRVLTDAEVKAYHQAEVRRHGWPVAVIDDRRLNREAIAGALGEDVLSLAIAIPGFTFDATSLQTAWRISTFETFDYVVGQPPVRRMMVQRYPELGLGLSWHGLYEGLGKNGLPYVLPRGTGAPAWSSGQAGEQYPFAALVKAHAPGTLKEDKFLDECTRTIPNKELARLEDAFAVAERMSKEGLTDPFPGSAQEKRALWLGLIAAWLHARDIETLMHALGFPIQATGVHDLEEYVPGSEIRSYIDAKRDTGSRFSPWLLRWLETVSSEEMVNVGFLNPVLLVNLLQWTPDTVQQDGMDVHRTSDHHDGDGAERSDPVEAAINNLLHQREGCYGLRKEPVVPWAILDGDVRRETGAEELGKSSVCRELLRDAIQTAQALEAAGAITAWQLVI